jgi:hypothetical protein
VQGVFERLTDIPPDEIQEALHSPQLSMFLFQFTDYMNGGPSAATEREGTIKCHPQISPQPD